MGRCFRWARAPRGATTLLRRFRTVLLLDFLSLVVIGLAAGAVFTSSALQPVRDLIATVRQIMRTGRIESRVQARDTGDALDQLSLLFNAMLDRIQALIGGMRGALDNVAPRPANADDAHARHHRDRAAVHRQSGRPAGSARRLPTRSPTGWSPC